MLDYKPVVTADPVKNAVLRDFGDFSRVVLRIYDGDADDASIDRVSVAMQKKAMLQTKKQVAADNETSKGVLRIWNARVTEIRKTKLGTVATVKSCGNESQWLAVSKATGKALPNDPEDKFNFSQTTSLVDTGDGDWRVAQAIEKFQDPECAR